MEFSISRLLLAYQRFLYIGELMFGGFKLVEKSNIVIMLIAMIFSIALPFMPPSMGVNGGRADAATLPTYICTGDGIIVIDQDGFTSDTPANNTDHSSHCAFCNTMTALTLLAWEKLQIGRVTSVYSVWHFIPVEVSISAEPSSGPFPPRAPPVLV